MSVVATRISATLLLALSLALGPFCARADLYSASVAYHKEDYAAAFKEFKDLAELGQPTAQFNLAVMYAKGQGTAVSNTYAHAWASLAQSNGQPKAGDLVAELEPQLTPASLRISTDIQMQFSAESLKSRLMPRYLNGREYADREPVRRVKAFMPEYPADAQHSGVQGQVFVEFVVATDGHARLPRILYALPAGYFEAAVRDSVLRSTFLPARVNGMPIVTTISTFYNFDVPGVKLADYGDLGNRVKLTLEKAEKGDTAAQLLYAMMIAGLPQLRQTYDKAIPWFLKAAQAGSPYAQYQLGTGLLQGRGCECDAAKGDIWLEKAAQADQPDAQVTLAEHLLRDHPTPESVSAASVWLERAAKQGNSSAKLYLAALLSTNPQTQVHDPARALALADSVIRDLKGDPTSWEVHAAAYAARGDFKDAGKDEARAMKQAATLGWDLTPLQGRMERYSANQPWKGDLLAF
ncbi:MAG: TonB family protein [Gammaproteobacteria bacterium]